MQYSIYSSIEILNKYLFKALRVTTVVPGRNIMTCQINHCMLVGWLSTQQIYTGMYDTDVALVIVVPEPGLPRW